MSQEGPLQEEAPFDRFIGQPIVRPHSFEGPYVLFPPGQPTLANLQAICLHSRHRPRYPPHSLPLTGFSWKRMEGDAINLVESWFGMCCQDKGSQGQEVTLCCVKQAWESSLNSFCQDQFSVKMRHHHCCKKIGDARMSCFQNEAPNPAYEPKEETPVPLSAPLPGFTFDPNTCQRHLKLRPVYLPKCLPSTGFGWLARQSKAINRVEKGFKRCCKGQDDTLTCADQKWREEMNSFCREAKGPKSYFPCCVMEGDERYNCFSSQAPHPGYDKVLSSAPLDPNFGQLCETHKFIPKK
ncbi:extracellular matrix protein 1-like [Aplochiton taeniatus]